MQWLKKFVQSRSKKAWITLAVLFMVGVGVAFVVKTLSDPSTGTIKQATAIPKTNNSDETVRVDGKSVSFAHAVKFHSKPPETLSPLEIEKFIFLNPETISQNLVIVVRKLPSGNLKDDGSYYAMTLKPDRYTFETKTIAGNTAVIATDKSEGFSKIAFIAHNGLEATIALNSSSTADVAGMQKSLDQVLEGWQWL